MATQGVGSVVEMARRGGGEGDAWPRRGNGGAQSERLATGLGWFSIGLGVAELVAPRAVARGIGLKGRGPTPTLTRLCGLRELAAGVGILSERRPATWVWSRVVGDVMDLALLAAGFAGRGTNRGRLAVATAAVAGVTVVDALCAQQLTGLSRVSVQTTAEGTLRVRRRATVNRPPDALFRFWRDFTNAPRFMERVEAVQLSGDRRTHWRAKGPAGLTVEWDAEVTDERPGELIAWRSTDDTPFRHSGVVRFEPAPACRNGVSSSERHAMSSPGRSSVTSASHSTARPPGPLARQCVRRSPLGCTDSTRSMKRGALLKSRQNR